MFLTYVACLLALYFVLARWSADDVRSDSETVLEYFTALATGLVMMQEVFRWCGVSVRGDAIERRNPVAAIVGSSTDRRDDVLSCGLEYRDGPGPGGGVLCGAFKWGAGFALASARSFGACQRHGND